MISSSLIISSAIALLIKAALFAVAKGELFIKNKILAAFLVTLFTLNLVEFLSFSFLYLETSQVALYTLKTFYAAGVFSAALFFILSISLAVINKTIISLFIIISSIFSIFILSGDGIIAGIQIISYTTTRIEGEYYWLLRIFLLLCLAAGIVVLTYNALKHKTRLVRQRSTVMLLGAAPLIVSTFMIIILMQAGYQINATVIISFCSSFLLVVLILTEARYRLFRFLSFVPFTHEYRLRNKANKLIDQMIKDLFDSESPVNYKEIRSELETILIELAIESTNGNKTRAARQLNIGKATLHRKIEGLHI